jgi:predicted transcriptional regulator
LEKYGSLANFKGENMNSAQEKQPGIALEEGVIEEIVAKVRAIAKGPHGELFFKMVDSFLEQTEQEIFTEEDLADIEEGMEDIRQGRCLTLEEYRKGKRL